MDKTKLLVLIAATGLLFAKPAFAEFNLQTANTNYGNAAHKDFKKAMSGDDMTERDHAEVADVLPPVDTNVWYARARVHLSRDRISKIKNNSLGVFSGLAVSEPVKTKHTQGLDVALGKIWDRWRVEAEYILVRDFEYKPNPALIGNANAMNATIKTNAFLANAYYELLDHDRLKPYVFFGGGMAINQADTNFNGLSKSKRTFGLAWSVGVGTRFRFANNLYFDVAIRHVNLGKFTLYNGANTKLKGKRAFNGVSAGVTFLFN